MSTTINDTSSNIMSTNIATTNLMPTNIETTNKYNLEYLTNPLYQKDLNKSTKMKAGVELNKEQCSFYRKRIIALTKEMLKGEYPSQHLEKIHKEYIQSLIHHFKRVDEIELIQKEYSDMNLNDGAAKSSAAQTIIDISNIQQLNNDIMMKKNKPISIDNFVTKKVIKIQKDIPVPQKKVLNVNTPAHKIKGLPPKQHKDKV
jgi:hypothetical protein